MNSRNLEHQTYQKQSIEGHSHENNQMHWLSESSGDEDSPEPGQATNAK